MTASGSKKASVQHRQRQGKKHETSGTSCLRLLVGIAMLLGGYWLGFLQSRNVGFQFDENKEKPRLRWGIVEEEIVYEKIKYKGEELDVKLNKSRLQSMLDPETVYKESGIPEGFGHVQPECRLPPEPGYPKKVSIEEIVKNWNPDEVARLPNQMYSSLCRFDFQTQFKEALAYRDAELPFQLYNVPKGNEIVRKWSDDDYMRRRLGANVKYKCEASNPGGEVNHGANHFMYTNGRPTKSKKPPPIKHVRLTFDEWLEKNTAAKNLSIDTPDSRYYFRFSASSQHDALLGWVYRDLSFFEPKPSIFIREPKGQRGIHCRFGMPGVIAEAHWDGSRNMIAQFYGRRRYILVDPDDSCNMYLLHRTHPSGRHSEVDWSKPDTWKDFPKFPSMLAHEVIQRPGDFLYLPTYYLHYIISIDRNYQCNSRSGRDDRQTDTVNRCTPGFEHMVSPAVASGRGGLRSKQRKTAKPDHVHLPRPSFST